MKAKNDLSTDVVLKLRFHDGEIEPEQFEELTPKEAEEEIEKGKKQNEDF